ncbi:DUF2306 domain-containing protein [uncultured Sphingomonas sp.]|uniref:DUF2306 domain-containing protein n=1 Tax=uncultured Sphingomonas sp. TaxID=158754 RepID=UPI0025DACA58|nr:DUF2306 domain-containing protein [uncultured Sphingomonas sp.]
MAAARLDEVNLPAGRGVRRSVLKACAMTLVAASWASGAIFGAYILAFFGGVALSGTADRWNESLPQLHDAATPLATIAIGSHFITGGTLLLLGPIQLIGAVRRRVPRLHRWMGRLYVLSAGLAGLGGLAFIGAKGTIGGAVMSAGFGLYGTLMVGLAVLTYAGARDRRYEAHRAWAIRLFALTVGSWLYRMEYGFWFLTVGRIGHDPDFSGWFDAAMAFFFYLPNLAVAEFFIRAKRSTSNSATNWAAAVILLLAAMFVMVATWSFTVDYWGPGMVSGFSGAPAA